MYFFVFFKRKTTNEMRISDWSSDVCSSDLEVNIHAAREASRCARSGPDTSSGVRCRRKPRGESSYQRTSSGEERWEERGSESLSGPPTGIPDELTPASDSDPLSSDPLSSRHRAILANRSCARTLQADRKSIRQNHSHQFASRMT